MALTEKHLKLISLAGTKVGAPSEIYLDAARDLISSGKLVRREVFTTGGNRKFRLFLAEAA
jgi:hypothetical protein